MHKFVCLLFFIFVVLGIGSCSYYYQHQQMTDDQNVKVKPVEKPEIYTTQTPPDFLAIHNIRERKLAFLNYLRPGIDYENQRISEERYFLQSVEQSVTHQQSLSQSEMKRLSVISREYKLPLPETGPDEGWFQKAFHRVDILPEALVFIQAANESAWGTSRFARQGNNYFGQWCYRRGCGLVPLARTEGATHEVAKFGSVQESIHRYFMNVNRNKAYTALREIRFNLRQQGVNIRTSQSAAELTNGLLKYSERGAEYVDSLKTMIRHNQKILPDNEPG
ncbi:hypothetical protein VA7868_02373 [Vibrio aerogenes CECT 7868]|uniref:Mannosyl-glycoprotein endo-beta-N-acetylglucosamidase-like domain-containing protein n=1 Tax=Vibrio aerogenes CECT 7868 TaxID=1216006 RepID=A0A1M5Z6R2_9VIBR|nr:glucosaminidase domain-containing protein [Vibrio aerogenes]SHI19965.1 hypothetical protein VA7868_02373 [Vibrio aerogenes CECT 7868]